MWRSRLVVCIRASPSCLDVAQVVERLVQSRADSLMRDRPLDLVELQCQQFQNTVKSSSAISERRERLADRERRQHQFDFLLLGERKDGFGGAGLLLLEGQLENEVRLNVRDHRSLTHVMRAP